MEEKLEGRKSEKRKEEGGWGGKAGWVPLGPGQRPKGSPGEAEGGGAQHHHRVALETAAGLGQEEPVGRSGAGLGQAWAADPGCSQPSSLLAKGEGRCGPMFWPLGIGSCQLTP